jgi:hypothetical protein
MSSMNHSFTRQSPSPRYRELLVQYQDLHLHGERRLNLPAEKTYKGTSLPRHAARIKGLVETHAARTLLDYGSGKGHQYQPLEVKLTDGRSYRSIPEFWGVEVTCYDPAYEPFRQLPSGKFDGVISTDVLEHCPEQDIPWILEEMFSYAKKFVFANVACYPAMKHLPNGENAHCTVRPKAWGQDQLAAVQRRHPAIRFDFLLDEMVMSADGKSGVRPQAIVG